MKTGLFARVSIALAVCLALTACNKKAPENDAAVAAPEGALTVLIGQASPLTGQQALLGKDNENGARLAIAELNAEQLKIGGKPVHFELDSQDDAADPRTASMVAQKFVDRGVSGVIGHLNSGTSIPASKLYADAGIVQVSPSATAIKYTAQGYKTAFRVMANDAQQGSALGDYAVHDLASKRIAIVDDRTAYGQGLADEFEKTVRAAGAGVVAHEFTTDKATEFSAILTRIKGMNPDLVFYAGMAPQAGPMVRQMHALGMKLPFLGGDGVRAEEFMTLAGKVDSEGVIASLPGVPLEEMPGGADFRKKFTAQYGEIQQYAPYAYDATRVLAAAMVQAGSVDPKVYLPALAAIEHKGVTGIVRFDGKGDVRDGAVTLYQVKSGTWAKLKTIGGVATAPAPVSVPVK